MSNIIEKIKNCGFDDIKLISEGGHGQCYFVKRNGVSYILKSFFCNSRAEAEHEEKIIKELHDETKGNPYFFKAEVISATDDVFFLLSHTNAGKTLEELKEKDTDVLSLSNATDIMIKACNSVQELHSKGYIHFDIKPSNLYLVDKISHVLAIDFGSAVKKGQKSYEEIIESNGYWSTRGFLSKKLSDFCELLSTHRNIEVSQEEKNKLVADEASLSVKEDIFALICTYWYMITGKEHFGIWNKDFRYLSTEQKIRLTLEENSIPKYLLATLTDLFLCIEEPSENADAEVPFESVNDLITVLEKVKEIEEEKEFHPEVILKKSLEHFLEDFKTTIKEELLCNILKQSSSSELEKLSVSLAEYIINNLKNHNNIQLVSEGGAGKTFQLLFAYKKLFEISASKKIIPLYIPMNRYNEEKNFIKDYIVAQYVGRKQNGQEDENNRNLLKDSIENHDYTFYLIIDSINESSAYPDVAYSEIKEISKWNNTRLVVASRNVSEHLSSFDQIELQKLTKDYLEINIPDFKGLNQSLHDLLGLPFYFEHYLEIDCSDKEQITSAAELIGRYHNWMLENIEKESVSPEKYSSFLRQLITKFLPIFSYKQMFSLHPLDFNDNDFMDSWNEFKTKNFVPFARDEHLLILKELGFREPLKIDSQS